MVGMSTFSTILRRDFGGFSPPDPPVSRVLVSNPFPVPFSSLVCTALEQNPSCCSSFEQMNPEQQSESE